MEDKLKVALGSLQRHGFAKSGLPSLEQSRSFGSHVQSLEIFSFESEKLPLGVHFSLMVRSGRKLGLEGYELLGITKDIYNDNPSVAQLENIGRQLEIQARTIARLETHLDEYGDRNNTPRNALTDAGYDYHGLFVDACFSGRLRWLQSDSEPVPYVLVDSGHIREIGECYQGLYFVAANKATARWQRQAVATHEHYCKRISHERALHEEEKLVDKMGMRKPWTAWRRQLEDYVRQEYLRTPA